MAIATKDCSVISERDVKTLHLRLPRETIQDLIELLKQLEVEEDVRVRSEIGKTLFEILFPESLLAKSSSESLLEVAKTREKLTEYRHKVGQQVRSRRRRLRMTQVQLARKARLPQSHICRIERGNLSATYITIKKIARALKVKPSALDPGFSDDD